MFVYDERYISKKEGHYYSCKWIEQGLVFFRFKIANCCICAHQGGGHTLLWDNYSGQDINWDRIFKIKDMYRRFHKKGKIHTNCIGCHFLKEDKWENQSNQIKYLYLSHWLNCNSKCIYCYTAQHPALLSTGRHYRLLPQLKNMYQKGILLPEAEISFGGGEPTLLDEFEDIMNFLLDNYFCGIRVHTSGIIYSPAIARAINNIRGYVVVSVDAGTAQTYERIKQVRCYDKVRDNIRKYALQTNFLGRFLVGAKYIIIPGVNDSIYEIESWLQANKEAGLYTTVIDIEENWYQEHCDNMPKKILDLIKYVEKRSRQLHTNLELYERLQNWYYYKKRKPSFLKKIFARK